MKKELLADLLEKTSTEIAAGRHEQAMQTLKRLFREDPSSLKGLHLRAQCYMAMKEFKLAIPDLLSIIQDHPTYSKHAYIEIATCFIESKDFSTAVRQITRGLLKFPKFVEGYLSRGTLYNTLKKWDKAISDFYEAISLEAPDGAGYLGLADSLIGIHEVKNALKMLEQAMKFPNTLPQALLKHGKLLFETRDFGKALEDLEQLINLESNNVEAHYYKAFSLLGQNNLINAAVALEQVIKYDSTKQFTGPAIYNLGAIKIKQRDFYGAHFAFQRAVELGVEIEEQKVLKGYVEAILCLMKRKFKEGVSLLTKIIKKKHILLHEYMGNCLAYRGYAYASLENHEKAVKDLAAAKKLQDLDHSSLYNFLVSQAILCGDSENSLSLLTKAAELFPKNIEPLMYKAAIIFTAAHEKGKPERMGKAKDLLDAALEMRESDSDLYFFRGILLYYWKKPIDAVYDLEKAIDKAEDNVPMHFLARGLCSAKLKMYKEAIQDFSIVLQLDDKVADAYFYRGRCAFIMEDNDQALGDFQEVLHLRPSDSSSHIHAANLLMATGAIEEAIRAFDSANAICSSSETHLHKAKCFALQENIPLVIEEIIKYNQNSKTAQNNYDIEVLTILQNALIDPCAAFQKSISQLTSVLQYKNEGNFCRNLHIHWFKGVFFFYLGEFEKAHAEFSSVITKRKKKSTVMERNNVELVYNLVLCCILSEKYEEAFVNLHDILPYTDNGDRGKLLMIMGILHYALDRNKEAKALLSEAFKYDSDTVGDFLEEKLEVKVFPLSSDSVYSKNFKYVKVSIGESHPIYLRPSFGVPRPELPSFDFDVETGILQNFSVKTVKCKPETPWLNRVKGSIQFTDEIQHYETESASEEMEAKAEDTDVFSHKSIRRNKSYEVRIRSPLEHRKIDDSNSSLSEIVDDFDDLNF